MGRERYDLSDETRNKGLRELTDRGLLDLSRRPVSAASFFDDRFRARNVYLIRPSAWTRAIPQRGPGAQRARAHPPPHSLPGPRGRTRKLWRNEAADTACVTRGSCGNTAVAAVSVNDRFATAVGNCQEV